jgi:hypothetical protein
MKWSRVGPCWIGSAPDPISPISPEIAALISKSLGIYNRVEASVSPLRWRARALRCFGVLAQIGGTRDVQCSWRGIAAAVGRPSPRRSSLRH